MKEKGITLMALIITIIILLILASITVATLTGDNGIITTAMEAREKTEIGEIEEQLRLAQMSAKLKKQGGDITIEDLIEELEKQGVDFEREEDGTLIIGGDYIYEFEEKNGEVAWENNGTMTTPKPKIVSIEILDKTESTIKVSVTTKRNGRGKLNYYIKEESSEYKYVGTINITENEETDTIEFILDESKIYTDIKVEAIAENGQTASKEIELSSVPTLKEGNVKFHYQVNGETINESDWTQGPMIVQMSIKNIENMAGYTIQYATADPKVESNWRDYTTGIQVNENTEICVRLKDKLTGETGREYMKKISNIDTKAPNIFTPTVDNADITTNSILVKGDVTDSAEPGETAGSGIAKYYFGIEEGIGKSNSWEPTWVPTSGQTASTENDVSYTFEGLKHTTTYSIRMKAVDKVGHETKSEIITVKTATVPNGITISYSNSNWTNGDVTVTLTNNAGSAYKLQYSKDNGGSWGDYSTGIVYSANGAIQARLTDNKNANETGNVGAVVSGNVLKIDKTVPSISTATPLTATSTTINSIALKIKATDTNSGLGKIKWYYKKSTDGSYTSVEDIYQAINGTVAGATTEQEKTRTLTGLTVGTTYNMYAEVYDVAGNKTTSSTINATTKRQYTVTYNANGGTGAPGNQIKTEGIALTLSATRPTRSGYAFKGWATSASATTAMYQPSASYTANANLNLFAVWGEKIVFSKGVSGSTGAGNGNNSTWESTATLPANCKITVHGSVASTGNGGGFASLSIDGKQVWSISSGNGAGAREEDYTYTTDKKVFVKILCSAGGSVGGRRKFYNQS